MSSRASTRDGKKSSSNSRASKRLSQERGSLLAGGSGDIADSEIRKIQRVLDRIPSDFKKTEDFNSLEHVIEILKSDDIDDRRARLENDVYEMDTSMETIVSLHYESFNKAIQNYTNLLSNVKEAMTSVQQLHEISELCSTLFSSRSHSVNNMYIQSLEYHHMIDILDKVEFIKQVPDNYQLAIEDGRYLEAAKTLVIAEEMLNQDDLLNIAALLHLRDLVIQTRQSFHNTIIEVLHDVCYLKYFIDLDHADDAALDAAAVKRISMIRAQRAYAVGVLDKTKVTAASFYAESTEQMLKTWSPLLTQLVEALYVLDRVKEGASSMLGRVRSEIRTVVQRTVNDIIREHEMEQSQASKNPVSSAAGPSFVSSSSLQKELEVSFEPSQFAKMLSVLFERCKLILANHKYIASAFLKKQKEVETNISRGSASSSGGVRKNASVSTSAMDEDSLFSTTSKNTYIIENVWHEMQAELLALLSFWVEADGAELGLRPSLSLSTGTVILPSHGSGGLAGTGSIKLFSFSRSAAFSAPDDEQNDFQFEDMNLGDSSAFNLPPLYPLIISFSESAVNHATPTLPSTEKGRDKLPQTLRLWLDDYVNSVFLTHIKAEYKLRAGEASEGPEAFKMKDRPRQAYSFFESQRPILSSVIEVFKCLKELYQDTVYMPSYAKDFHSIMELLLRNFLELAQSHFDAALKNAETANMLQNDSVVKAATSDPQWKRALNAAALANASGASNAPRIASAVPESVSSIDTSEVPNSARSANVPRARGHVRNVSLTGVGGDVLFGMDESASDAPLLASELGGDDSSRDQRLEVENNLYKGLTIGGFPLTKRSLISDTSKLEKLALMHDSLSWLCERMDQIDKAADQQPRQALPTASAFMTPGKPQLRKRGSGQLTTKKPGEEDSTNAAGGPRVMGTPARKHHRDRSIAGAAALGLLPAAPKFSAPIVDLLARIKELSEKCLIALRVEYRVRCFYYLDGLRKSSWSFDANANKPDQCVLEFNSDLAESHEVFYVYLPTAKIRYVYGTLPRLISSVLISALTRLENFNRSGVMKMIRDVFSLQQTLTNVITFDPEPLDRVRRYYELLLLTPEEVFQQIQENLGEPWKLFTFPEYRTVLEYLSPGRQVPEAMENELRAKLAQAAKQKEKRREMPPPTPLAAMSLPPGTPLAHSADLSRATLASPGMSIRRKPSAKLTVPNK
eukprot:TRINITY_DN5727_c1_g1_i1.p1 TRINITY_DN5727_c1_g1~~TRINITY_DN5727_c1_g1_i1.p1  ORF type:complete len:1196 (+),score=222.83 TRINITY_DN5727_c1_g1_i1:69-3656(+)